MRHATEVFSEWALRGKDEGMEKNHLPAVTEMVNQLVQNQQTPFSFIDAGCGNGWVVRMMKEHPLCEFALGIDGAEDMIRKAQSLDKSGHYVCADLLEWQPDQKVDLIHSMEVFYYFKNPNEIINHIANHWLKPRGKMIMGIDFYFEHKQSHSWPHDVGTPMTLLKEKDWITLFMQNGFMNIENFRSNTQSDFPGTCVIYGELKDV